MLLEGRDPDRTLKPQPEWTIADRRVQAMEDADRDRRGLRVINKDAVQPPEEDCSEEFEELAEIISTTRDFATLIDRTSMPRLYLLLHTLGELRE